MMKILWIGAFLLINNMVIAQQNKEVPQKIERPLVKGNFKKSNEIVPMTPSTLWELGRVSGEGLTIEGDQLIYGVVDYDLGENKSEKNIFITPISGGKSDLLIDKKGSETILKISNEYILFLLEGQIWKKNLKSKEISQVSNYTGGLENVKISPDEKYILYSKQVLIHPSHSVDKYIDMPKSNVYIYDNLDYRHWDSWNDGKYNHPFVAKFDDGEITEEKDLLENEPYYSPQMPFGGIEDFEWAKDSKSIFYVSKKKAGNEYVTSTNTDIFQYDLDSKKTINITQGMDGYDTNPSVSPSGNLVSWLSMKTDGYESDKNDIFIVDQKSEIKINLTGHWDGTVSSFKWSKDNSRIYFLAPTHGTVQLFEVLVPSNLDQNSPATINRLSSGNFDITAIIEEADNALIVSLTTMTSAAEIFSFDLKSKDLKKITTVNDAIYSNIAETKVESRVTKASDGKDLFSWVIYPPDFDPNKKYPTLLFCQGGPQAATTQSYSLRWNFQLMASQGYIVIAPNRRGMPGWGVEWNEQISKDWGGQAIQDYIAAIDDIAQESYVDSDRLGAIGASYGGYSVFQLAGIHQGRFKTFISHCGLFDMTSWYGTTEELFFANHDLGGPYWDEKNAQTYQDFNPIRHVEKWNTPILIFQGGNDFRVPRGQGQQAFQAAQLKGIKSRFIFLPEENHWVLSGQNAQVWQREFFGWLSETL